jgi:hypothetical protein
MAQIQIPQRKNDNAKIIPLAGAAVGGAYGGPQGAMAGYSAGGMAGEMTGASAPPKQPQTIEGGQAAAIARRSTQQNQDNLEIIRRAQNELSTLSESNRQYVAPILAQARAIEERRRGMTNA